MSHAEFTETHERLRAEADGSADGGATHGGQTSPDPEQVFRPCISSMVSVKRSVAMVL
jgi:hypothetical protein